MHDTFESLHTNKKSSTNKIFIIANVVEAYFGYYSNEEVNISDTNIRSGVGDKNFWGIFVIQNKRFDYSVTLIQRSNLCHQLWVTDIKSRTKRRHQDGCGNSDVGDNVILPTYVGDSEKTVSNFRHQN